MLNRHPFRWILVFIAALGLFTFGVKSLVEWASQPFPCPGAYYVTVTAHEWTEFSTGAKVIAVHDAHSIQERHCTE